ALHVLGRGNCFDVNGQCSSVSAQLSRQFFHEFCEKFVHELHTTWIFLPDVDDLKRAFVVVSVVISWPGVIATFDIAHWDVDS
ncbi:unnamed protein product, partial [Sphacelaria rigidula]